MDDTHAPHGNAVTALEWDSQQYRPPEPEPDPDDDGVDDSEDAWGTETEPTIDPRGRTRLIPPSFRHADSKPEPGYEPSKGDMPPRKLRTVTGPGAIRIGRLIVRDAGGGWLMVTLLTPCRDCESELLPPAEAKTFTKWISGGGRLN
jgi:hypothetical protein